MLLKANLLKDPENKLSKMDLAADEAVKLKRLTGGIRTLWRSSENAHHPRVTELKALLRPSPRKIVFRHLQTNIFMFLVYFWETCRC